jgi:thioredoxin reductase
VRRVAVCDSGRYRNERSGALHCFVSRDGIPPSELLAESRRQLGRYDTITLLPAKVASAGRSGRYFEIVTDDGRALQARNLLVATGVVDELPRIEGIDALFGHSVHVCPYCDGWEHRNASIAIYGRGKKGAGLALLIRQWSDDVVLCTDGEKLPQVEHRRLQGRGVQIQEERIRRLHGADGSLAEIEFGDGTRLARRALFFNTDQHPRSPILERLGCAFDDDGGVRCSETGETSIPGVFAAGDVSRDAQLAIIAAAEGARAALAINKRLLEADGGL